MNNNKQCSSSSIFSSSVFFLRFVVGVVSALCQIDVTTFGVMIMKVKKKTKRSTTKQPHVNEKTRKHREQRKKSNKMGESSKYTPHNPTHVMQCVCFFSTTFVRFFVVNCVSMNLYDVRKRKRGDKPVFTNTKIPSNNNHKIVDIVFFFFFWSTMCSSLWCFSQSYRSIWIWLFRFFSIVLAFICA